MGSGDTFLRPFVLGVTGAAGSGKSMLCRFLKEEYEFEWINADDVVHDLYKPNGAGYRKIKEYFGDSFVGEKGVLRGRLRRFVLKTPEKIWILNKIMHALVTHEVNKKIVHLKALYKGKKQLRVCLEAVYFEPQDLGKFIDQLIIVDAQDSLLISRIRKRKIPPNQIAALVKFQRKHLPRSSGYVLENEGSVEVFFKNIRAFYDKILP